MHAFYANEFYASTSIISDVLTIHLVIVSYNISSNLLRSLCGPCLLLLKTIHLSAVASRRKALHTKKPAVVVLRGQGWHGTGLCDSSVFGGNPGK